MCLDTCLSRSTMGFAGLVAELVRESGIAPGPNAKAMAYALGLRLRPVVRVGSELCGRDVFYDRREPLRRQQWLVARCVAVWALRSRGMVETDFAVRWLADELVRQERRRSGLFRVLGA
jgi:hypothetical protein